MTEWSGYADRPYNPGYILHNDEEWKSSPINIELGMDSAQTGNFSCYPLVKKKMGLPPTNIF